MISIFVCALVQKKDQNGVIMEQKMHDMFLKYDRIINSKADFIAVKELAATEINVDVRDLTIMNLSVLFQF